MAIAVALGTAGCTLAAHNHPCWPWVDHRFEGRVPPEVVKELTHDRGARREVMGRRAPTGAYWRPRHGGLRSHDPFSRWELARCPSGPPGRPTPRTEEELPSGPVPPRPVPAE